MKYALLFLLGSVHLYGAELLNVKGKVMEVDFGAKRVELYVPAYRGISPETRVCLQGSTDKKQVLDLKCGKVLSVNQQKVQVEVTKGGLSFALGEFVNMITENRSNAQDRMIASYYDNLSGQTPSRSGLAAGMTFGLTYFFPSVHLELALSHAVTLGVTGIYGDAQSNNTRNKTYGGLLGLTYYTAQPALGLHFEVLAGMYNSQVTFTGSVSEKIDSLVGAALVGWKGYLSEQFHYRVNAGAQYVSNQRTPQFLDFSNVLPFFRAEVGVSF
ncbi:hypothetical protein EBR78_02440 [bacterium]|nr:hypothetical protein [bacterium]